MAYATEAEYEEYTGEDSPTGVLTSLDRASDLLDVALIGCCYTVDASENPTDATVIAAFRDAVCAQVQWWVETGDETGAAGQYSSVSIGSVALVRANSATSGQSPGTLCPRAVSHLRVAGLLPAPIGVGYPSIGSDFFGSST